MKRCLKHTSVRKAFTLVELLITVAIIAILAAIAVPNFLEAQIRAKVTRVKSELRTTATAIEAYCADNNHPPYDGEPGADHYGWATVLQQVTTPVAYMTRVQADPFQDPIMKTYAAPAGQTFFVDHPTDTRHSYDYGSAYWHKVGADSECTRLWQNFIGTSSWKIGSCGPRQKFLTETSYFGFAPKYDPTNGTLSDGNIYRSQAVLP